MGTEEKDLHDRLFVRDFDTLSKALKRNYRSDGKLSHKAINRGIVLPFKKSADGRSLGGVCDENFNFIAGSAMKRLRTPDILYYGVINGGYSVAESELEYCDETVVYGGSIPTGFYESMFVFFPAFNWWNVYHTDSSYKVVFISFNAPFSQNPALKKSIINYMDLINIKEERLIFCDKPTKFKEIIVPDTSICPWHDYYDEYAMLFDYIRNSVEPAPYKKIYLTRREYDKRGNAHDYINEEYFENFYNGKGYEIISPEKYSLKEQAAIFSGADEIVSISSSATVIGWTLAKPGTKVVCLNRVDDMRDWNFITFALIAQMKKLNYYFIDISYNFLQQSLDFGASLFGPTEYWKEYVKMTFGDDIIVDREAILKEFSYQYIKNWTQLSMYPNWYKFKKNIDNFDILNDMCRVVLGIELDKSKYDVGLTKLELNRKVNELNRKVNELNVKLENANKELSNDTRLAKLSAIERQIGSVADVIQKAQLSSTERESLMKQNAALSAQIETQNSYINYANTNLEKMQENNKLLSDLCKSVTDKKDELAKANESMTAEAVIKDRKIEELTSDLENSQNVISDLKSEADILKANMSADISSKEHQIEELNSSLSDSKNVILNLQNDVNALKEHITNMENSRSWKITKPLRAIKRLFSKG